MQSAPKFFRFEQMLLTMFRKICAVAVIAMFALKSPDAVAQGSLSKETAAAIALAEDSLTVIADSMYSSPIPEERMMLSERFARQLVRTLKTPNSWAYKFEKLSQKINIIYPEDKSFRMFNWTAAPSDVTRRYYGAIQMPSEQLKLYGLVDYTSELGKGAADSVLTGGKWMGCIYYRIIDKEVDGRKLYTMLGMNASTPASNKKIIDILEMTPTGPKFGAQLIGIRSENFPGRKVNRFILEYKKDVQASMNWDSELNAIFFDRLVSEVNDPGRKYTYVPSGQYDGFRWENNEWRLYQDLIKPLQLKDGEAPVDQPR